MATDEGPPEASAEEAASGKPARRASARASASANAGASAKARPFGLRGLGGGLVFLLAAVLIALTLSGFASRIERFLSVHYDWRLELALVLGQVAFQWSFLLRRTWEERLSYAWILISVSGLGAVLLWPLLLSPSFSPRACLAWFFGVVGVMFLVHWKLVVAHGLPKRLCITWVVYRLLILSFVAQWR